MNQLIAIDELVKMYKASPWLVEVTKKAIKKYESQIKK